MNRGAEETFVIMGNGCLFDDPGILQSLKRISARFTSDPDLQEEMLQECLVHLWRTEHTRPGQTRSWYLQSCRFHLLHWLRTGRSIDNRGRADTERRIAVDGDAEHPALNEFHNDLELFETICLLDTISILRTHLGKRQRLVLAGLAAGFSITEIASTAGLSYPTVLKDRRTIAKLTAKLGITRYCLK